MVDPDTYITRASFGVALCAAGGAIGAADVPPACWSCSLRSRRTIMGMELTFTQKLRFFVSGSSSAAPLGVGVAQDGSVILVNER